jgi:hypothetical protein
VGVLPVPDRTPKVGSGFWFEPVGSSVFAGDSGRSAPSPVFSLFLDFVPFFSSAPSALVRACTRQRINRRNHGGKAYDNKKEQ